MRVFVIPGFMGTKLDELSISNVRTRAWTSYEWLSNPLNWRKLHLGPDGVSPGPLSRPTVRFAVAGLHAGYYDYMVPVLLRHYQVTVLEYDWRLASDALAARLQPIIDGLTGSEEFAIVAHSYGGLIARAIWQRYHDAGTQQRIKRIVTIATPHYGTYAATRVLAHLDATYQLVANAVSQRLYDYVRLLPNPFFSRSILIDPRIAPLVIDQLDAVIASWPALLEMMPHVQEPGAAGWDPYRARQYRASTWSAINAYLTQATLDRATRAHARLARAVPPVGQLVPVVILDGRPSPDPTWDAINEEGSLADNDTYRAAPGDGRVTISSQRGPWGSPLYYGTHADAANHAGVLKDLPFLIDFGSVHLPSAVNMPPAPPPTRDDTPRSTIPLVPAAPPAVGPTPGTRVFDP